MPAAAPGELSGNQQCSSHCKAALREAVIAKKRFAHMLSHNTKYPFIINTLGEDKRCYVYTAPRDLAPCAPCGCSVSWD
jgi:hypothetical protein